MFCYSLIQAIQIFRSADFLSFTLAKYFSFHDFPIGYLFWGGGGGMGGSAQKSLPIKKDINLNVIHKYPLPLKFLFF